MFVSMSPLFAYLAVALAGVELAAIVLAAVGATILVLARFFAGGQAITPRAYAKLYSGAPGANSEEKPEAR